MFSIRKTFTFSASHVLTGLPDGHPCGRLHGHNYVVELELAGPVLDPTGFVRDYGELAPFDQWPKTHVDHRHLNDVMPEQPGAERLAAWVYETWHAAYPELVAVHVSETPKTFLPAISSASSLILPERRHK